MLALNDALTVVMTFVAAACAASLLWRFRRAGYDQRQQLKWFVFAAGFMVVNLAIGDALPVIVGDTLFALSSLALSGSIGVAIFKYRLYDIDLIINRTVVYTALTGALALAYFGIVLVSQGLLTERAARSPVVVAATTLAVAALFRPARRRIQDAVDQRFNRSRYDAARTIDAFSARLRDEIDLDALSTELLAVVGDTMSPAHMSLWLAGSTGAATFLR